MNEQYRGRSADGLVMPSASEKIAILGSAIRRERQTQGISQQRLADAI